MTDEHECAYDTPGTGPCETCLTDAMTDERMTQGDVRLRDALAAAVHNEVLLRVACRDTRWEDWTDIADALAPVVERIVAARVGEVAALRAADALVSEEKADDA